MQTKPELGESEYLTQIHQLDGNMQMSIYLYLLVVKKATVCSQASYVPAEGDTFLCGIYILFQLAQSVIVGLWSLPQFMLRFKGAYAV